LKSDLSAAAGTQDLQRDAFDSRLGRSDALGARRYTALVQGIVVAYLENIRRAIRMLDGAITARGAIPGADERETTMESLLRMTFRGFEPTVALEDYVRRRAAKLDRFSDRLAGINVNLERPHAHKHRGRRFHVRIALTVPGATLVVARTRERDPSSTDLYAAIDAAFDDAGRVLQDHTRKRRGEVKTHAHDRRSRGAHWAREGRATPPA